MENKKIIRFVEGLILLPIITISAPVGNALNPGLEVVKTSSVAFLQKQNNEIFYPFAFTEAVDEEVQVRKLKAEAIDAYFSKYDMPLFGTGMKMVLEAEKNNLDWRLLPAITVRESTGGKFECKKADFNFFGWGSCKINFESVDHAIERVAFNLGGNNPKTEKYYKAKTVKEILRAYNPPSVVPRYAEQVIKIMNAIGDEKIIIETKLKA